MFEVYGALRDFLDDARCRRALIEVYRGTRTGSRYAFSGRVKEAGLGWAIISVKGSGGMAQEFNLRGYVEHTSSALGEFWEIKSESFGNWVFREPPPQLHY
jgi:hypothetical protein